MVPDAMAEILPVMVGMTRREVIWALEYMVLRN